MNFPSKSHIAQCVCCPQLIKDPVLRAGLIITKTSGGAQAWNGGFSTVFKILKNGEYWAFKVWHTHLDNMEKRYGIIQRRLEDANLPYFIKFAYEKEGLFDGDNYIPTHRMKWVDGLRLDEYINRNINDPDLLLAIASNFRRMVLALHKNKMAHGDLQHGNIIVDENRTLRLIDYDSVFTSELVGEFDIIKGQGGYQHPKRETNESVFLGIDNFSEIVIYLSLVTYADYPELWDNDTDWMLFSKDDFLDPDNSTIISTLKESNNSLIRYLTSSIVAFLDLEHILDVPSLEDLLNVKPKTIDTDLLKITDCF